MRNGAVSLTRRFAATPCRRSTKSAAQLLRWSSTGSGRTWSTPLAKTIADVIETTGPISIAAYMRQCLTSPQGGYYTTTREQSDQFGRKGDFITSPEISQVFGELVGIWFVTEWMAQGRKSSGVQLIELGPGRGTLMDDVLRTIATFKAFANSIETVYLVEASEGLREAQKKVLCGEDRKMERTENGWRCVSKYLDIPVSWVEDINLLPKDERKETMPLIVAHEFFDALPIHAFESVAPTTAPPDPKTKILDSSGKALPMRQPSASAASKAFQWRELLVTPTPRRTSPSPLSTQAETEQTPDFHLVHAYTSTPTSLVLPESSPRYQALKSTAGSFIEISPDSSRHIADIACRIGGSPGRTSSSSSSSSTSPSPSPSPSPSSSSSSSSSSTNPPCGAALIIDYGPTDTIPINSLRGIKAHRRVSPFHEPGLVDLSADVDFTALAEAACQASPGVEVWGPVEQGGFLGAMGGEVRVGMLLKGLTRGKGGGAEEAEEKRKVIERAWRRLVEKGGGGMGWIYKALAVLPESGGRRKPVGFGGGVGVGKADWEVD